MSYYRHEMRLLLTRRTGDWLKRQSWPRSFSAAVLLIAGIAAAASWTTSLDAGLMSAGWKAALSCIAAYVAYLAAVAVWFVSFSPMDPKQLLAGAIGAPISTQIPGESQFDNILDASIDTAVREAGNNARGVLGFFIAAAVFGSLFLSIHFVFHAPYYLGELLVDGGKIRHRALPTGKSVDAILLPFLQSWPSALILLLHYMVVGFLIDMTR